MMKCGGLFEQDNNSEHQDTKELSTKKWLKNNDNNNNNEYDNTTTATTTTNNNNSKWRKINWYVYGYYKKLVYLPLTTSFDM